MPGKGPGLRARCDGAHGRRADMTQDSNVKRARQLRGALGGQGLTAQTRHDQAGAQMCTARQGAMALLVAGAVAAMALPVPSQAQVPAQEARAQQLPFDIAAPVSYTHLRAHETR